MLNDLRNISYLLREPCEGFQKCIERLQSTLQPFEFGRGLASLPDNLLAYIFKLILDHWAGFLRPKIRVDLSLVCYRFRSVLLGTPRLWNKISTDNHDFHVLDLCLQRSKTAGLCVDISCYEWGDWEVVFGDKPSPLPESIQAFHALLSHCDRWEGIYLHLHRTDLDTPVGYLSGLRLPRVEHLVIEYSNEPVWYPLPPSDHFYTTCELPNLRTLHILYTVPLPFSCPALKSLSISTENIDFVPAPILHFLDVTQTLEEVALHVTTGKAIHSTEDLQNITLPNIKTLKISMRPTSLGVLMPLRKALHTPNVQKIELVIDGRVDYCEKGASHVDRFRSRYLNFFMFCHKEYPALDEFRFEYHANTHRDHRPERYDIPFPKIPGLRVLKLDTDTMVPNVIPGDETLPSLSHIYPGSFSSECLKWLRSVHRLLSEQDKLLGLKAIFIEREKGWDNWDNRFNDHFPGTRVIWSGYERRLDGS